MWLANLFLTGVCISSPENGYTWVEQVSKHIIDKESLCSHCQRRGFNPWPGTKIPQDAQHGQINYLTIFRMLNRTLHVFSLPLLQNLLPQSCFKNL